MIAKMPFWPHSGISSNASFINVIDGGTALRKVLIEEISMKMFIVGVGSPLRLISLNMKNELLCSGSSRGVRDNIELWQCRVR